MGSAGEKIKISYLLNAFPKLSETFILNEIWELRNKGIDIFLVALKKTKEKVTHTRADAIAPEVIFLNDLRKRRKFENALLATIRHPLRFMCTISYIMKRLERNKAWTLKQVLYLGGEFIRNGIRHIHVHFALDAAEKAMFVWMLTGIPYSINPHALDIYLRPKMLRDKMKFAKFISTVCEFNKRYLLEYFPGYPESKITVIRLGIDLKYFSPKFILSQEKDTRNGLEISSVARLVEKKGMIYLLEALKRIEDDGIKAKVKIVGDGPEQERLEKFIQENRMGDRVELMGPRPSEYVKSLFDASDVFVLPCIVAKNGDQDATPTAILEAMAMKVPVISTKVAGIPEVIPGEAGIIVPPNDIDALVTALKRISDMSHVDRDAMGEAGRKFVATNCNVEKGTAKLQLLIEDVSGR